MPQPERPFIPRRTPTRAQPAVGASDFTVSRPFVPGADRAQIESFRLEPSSEIAAAPTGSIPSIDTFLEYAASSHATAGAETNEETIPEDFAGEEDELPPVEHFVDPLPPVGDFAADAPVGDADEFTYSDNTAEADAATTDWVETDWQKYDWRAVAALGDSGESEASSAWADTDWDVGLPREKETKPTAANAIATALDQIAQKIRDGELALPGPGTVTDPRTIATTLAALLGIRQ